MADGQSGGQPSATEEARVQAERTREQAEDLASRASERAAQVGEQARATLEEQSERGRERVAENMDQIADRLRGQGDGGPTGKVTDRAAEGIERTAGYLRERDAGEMLSGFEGYVRKHPLQGVAVAVAAGFLVARMLR